MKPQGLARLTAFFTAGVLSGAVALCYAGKPGEGSARDPNQVTDPADRPARGDPQPPVGVRDKGRPDEPNRQPGTGVLRHEDGAFDGYTLFAPLRSTKTYLIDMQGRVAHSWDASFRPGHAVYLLENGRLLGCAQAPGNRQFKEAGGRIHQLDWDGTIIWESLYATGQHMQHHDLEPMPNGNVLLIAWETKSPAEAIAAGRDPEMVGRAGLWPDHVVELEPEGRYGGSVVWEWHVWDHLIQDHDPTKANFGVVADHPELVDLNALAAPPPLTPQEQRRLESLGYVAASSKPGTGRTKPDWNHTNSVAYNAELDQIALSVLEYNELWVIDHSTTTAEARGHNGGRSGKGGDLLYRWGNPQAYGAGTARDQQLFAQHDVHWIPSGRKGAGNFLIFNNGRGRPDGVYSSVIEIKPPVDSKGQYVRTPGTAFGPTEPVWTYTAPERTTFYSSHVSGAQRLPNGNTLICSGGQAWFFEVDPAGKTVWEYVHSLRGEGRDRRTGNHPRSRSTRPAPDEPGPPGDGSSAEQEQGVSGQRWTPPPGHTRDPTGIFRAIRLPADYPGLAGKDLDAAKP